MTPRRNGSRLSKLGQAQLVEKANDIRTEQPSVTNTAIAAELGVSRVSLWGMFKKLTTTLEAKNLSAHEARVATQEAVLEFIEEQLLEGNIPTEVADSWRRIRSDIAKLRGLNAETKHLRVNVNTSANQNGRFHRFVTHVAGLSDSQLEEVFRFADSLPRDPLPEPAGPPLLEGEVL